MSEPPPRCDHTFTWDDEHLDQVCAKCGQTPHEIVALAFERGSARFMEITGQLLPIIRALRKLPFLRE